MSDTLKNKVCLHCGGALQTRHGSLVDVVHARKRGSDAPVCRRLPEPVTRAEYESSKAQAPQGGVAS